MSMLAERKRKTKWVVNPMKKPLWATDSNGIKFGKDLMEKMGWSAGKGLGAKEQGIQEPLRVSYKNDTKGMGFKGNVDDWIEQQDEFNVLLSQLRSSDDSSVVKISEEDKSEIKSLEQKSRQSKARVHYQKFTRGKDLSRYSENDLACILGTKKMKKERSKMEESVQADTKTDCRLETSFGVTTINSGSIQDYFKKKWINDKAKSIPDADKEEEEHSWYDERPSFSMGHQESLEEESKKHSRKRKHKSEDETLDVDGTNFDDKYEKSMKKKKKKKDVEVSEEEEPQSKKNFKEDNSLDVELQAPINDVAVDEEPKSLLGNENLCDFSRKRKKEKKHSKLDHKESFEENLQVEPRKKKKKKEKSVENDCCDTQEVAIGLEADGKVGEEESDKKKKKKDKHKGEGFNELTKENMREHSLEVSVGVEGQDGVVAKVKKKKKKCKEVDESAERNNKSNVKDANSGKVADVLECDTDVVVHKKKKKKKEKQEGNPTECCGQQNGIPSDIPPEICDGDSKVEWEQPRPKKKKKKDKHREKEESGSGRNEESCSEETCQEGRNETEKKKKKKDKKLKTEVESSVDQQKEESKESESDHQFAKPPEGESTKKKKKKDKKVSESEAKKEVEEKEVKTFEVVKESSEEGWGDAGNAEIGMGGVDSMERVTQGALYEHNPGTLGNRRVMNLFPWANFVQFRGSNLVNLNGYGTCFRKYVTSAT